MAIGVAILVAVLGAPDTPVGRLDAFRRGWWIIAAIGVLGAVAAVLVLVAIAYAALAGADFGGGIWDLLAGSASRGRAVRDRIDHSITPVWESNHVWLIIMVVVLWTGFPIAFGWIFTTLFVPLSASALGIVLRGAGFAFRPEVRAMRWEPVAGAVFAFASLLTPFFLGTAVGAVVTRYPCSPRNRPSRPRSRSSSSTSRMWALSPLMPAACQPAARGPRVGFLFSKRSMYLRPCSLVRPCSTRRKPSTAAPPASR